jgi:hypothetical protein
LDAWRRTKPQRAGITSRNQPLLTAALVSSSCWQPSRNPPDSGFLLESKGRWVCGPAMPGCPHAARSWAGRRVRGVCLVDAWEAKQVPGLRGPRSSSETAFSPRRAPPWARVKHQPNQQLGSPVRLNIQSANTPVHPDRSSGPATSPSHRIGPAAKAWRWIRFHHA